MYMKFEITENYQDATNKNTTMSIRSEVIAYVMESIGDVVVNLQNSLNQYDSLEVISSVDGISQLIGGLTANERAFINWISADNRTNKEPVADSRGYWDSDSRWVGIANISNVMQTHNRELIDVAVARWKMVFAQSIPNNLRNNNLYYDSTNIDSIGIEGDILYSNFVEYLISEYIEIINVNIRRSNRDAKDAKRCEKCGTEFQLSKSLNMHISKCNGVNRGYLPFVPKGSKADRVSEW